MLVCYPRKQLTYVILSNKATDLQEGPVGRTPWTIYCWD